MAMNKYVFAILVLAVAVSGCAEADKQVVDPITNIGGEIRANAWMDVRLVDLQAQRSYRISEYQEPIFVSIYNPSCEQCAQQHEQLNSMDQTAYILINTDRSQTAEQALSHGYSATTSIANQEFIQAIEKSRAANNELILVCPSGSYEVLNSQTYSSSELESMAADCN